MPLIIPFLDIQEKVDTPEKLTAVAGKPTQNYLFAAEINTIVEKINSLWSSRVNVNYIVFETSFTINGISAPKGVINVIEKNTPMLDEMYPDLTIEISEEISNIRDIYFVSEGELISIPTHTAITYPIFLYDELSDVPTKHIVAPEFLYEGQDLRCVAFNTLVNGMEQATKVKLMHRIDFFVSNLLEQ